MEIVRKDAETKCIYDMNAGDCFQRDDLYFMATNKFLTDSQQYQYRLCVNLSNGLTNFVNVWNSGIPVKAKVVIGEE